MHSRTSIIYIYTKLVIIKHAVDKLAIMRESFEVIITKDGEAQILPRALKSNDPHLTKGSDLSKTNLRPVYATPYR